MKVTKKYVNDAKEDAARGCANAKLQERCAGLGYALLPPHPGPLPTRYDGATARRVGWGEGEKSLWGTSPRAAAEDGLARGECRAAPPGRSGWRLRREEKGWGERRGDAGTRRGGEGAGMRAII